MERVNLTITLPDDMKEKLERIAKEQHRSQSAMIAYLIRRYRSR